MLSSASLFHFTSSLETLKKILAGEFKPFYSSEDLKMFGIPESPGIPMVSFCDIPLSQADKHVNDYGRYSIGVSKKWGMDKNISPVHYIYPESICAHVVSDIYHRLPQAAHYADCTCMRFNTSTAIFFYGKPYSGDLIRKDRFTGEMAETKDVCFYDEREWRYVPFADQTMHMDAIPEDVRTMLSENEMATPDVLTRATESLHGHYGLSFEPRDVKYLIVSREDEIPELVDFIESLHGVGPNPGIRLCSEDDRKRLKARVISLQQIEEDF